MQTDTRMQTLMFIGRMNFECFEKSVNIRHLFKWNLKKSSSSTLNWSNMNLPWLILSREKLTRALPIQSLSI